MTKTWTQVIAALMFALAVVVSTSVFAEDDVFVDEGDGDFDTSMPAAAPAAPEVKKSEPAAAAPVAQKAAEPAPDMSAVEDELATPTIVEEKTETPAPNTDDMFGDEDKSAPVVKEEKPVKKAVEKKVVEKKVEKKKAVAHKEKKAAKVAKSFKKGHGYFAWTNDSCKLQRSPASVKKTLGETAASKKIWVEDFDKKFVKVWNKAGDEAYLSRDCLK